MLVLLDASIVISEIILEIQSLQMYKNSFRSHLQIAREIICKFFYINSPDNRILPGCLQTVESAFSGNATTVLRLESATTSVHAEQSDKVWLCYHLPKVYDDHNRNERDSDMDLPNDADSVQKDNELIEVMSRLAKHWYAVYDNRLACAVQNISNLKGTKYLLTNQHVAKAEPFYQSDFMSSRNSSGNLIMDTIDSEAFLKNDPHLQSHSTYPSVQKVQQDDDKLSQDYTDKALSNSLLIGAKTMHDVSAILHYLSIAITGLFLLCVILKIACLGRKFFRDRNQHLDAGIIVASFISDVLYVRYVSETTAAMVVLLLWRIFRIINALMMHKQHQYELRISMQKRARRLLGRKLEIIQTEKEMHEKHIATLEDMLRELGSSNEAIKKCKPRYKECTKEQTNNALKSIAALTTGVMGGLVGAPSNIQGVINRYGGNTGLTTPTASQKSLQQICLHGILGHTDSSSNISGKRSLIARPSPASQDSSTSEKFPPAIAKSTSTTFEFTHRSNMYISRGLNCGYSNSSERSLVSGTRRLIRSYFIRNASCEGEIPIRPSNVHQLASCRRQTQHQQPRSDENEKEITKQDQTDHETNTGNFLPKSSPLEANRILYFPDSEDRNDAQPTEEINTVIHDLRYPKRLFYLKRLRLTGKGFWNDRCRAKHPNEVPATLPQPKPTKSPKLESKTLEEMAASSDGFNINQTSFASESLLRDSPVSTTRKPFRLLKQFSMETQGADGLGKMSEIPKYTRYNTEKQAAAGQSESKRTALHVFSSNSLSLAVGSSEKTEVPFENSNASAAHGEAANYTDAKWCEIPDVAYSPKPHSYAPICTGSVPLNPSLAGKPPVGTQDPPPESKSDRLCWQ
ncbi:hypothetical protein EG68_03459 [Paragonimus skrjabini miyazakii]|uniref:Voltage-gated hydrogen channel 1 n=1 Tax=Paragonimus skrjabini miyazakii TaxID=59628 RepID=A0A8S9YX72_9TREM|nr:hypothetical protein EG68_03459 [Paragonimus skrjabini miyazakii]